LQKLDLTACSASAAENVIPAKSAGKGIRPIPALFIKYRNGSGANRDKIQIHIDFFIRR
jgi:hypothetical protein